MTIKDLRLEKGMTLSNFAKAIGIGMSTLTSYEAGKRKPGEKALAAIKEVFGVDLNEAAAAVETVVENAVKTVEAAVAPASTAEPAPVEEVASEAVPAVPLKEKKTAAKKLASKKEKTAPAKKEKAAPAKKEAKAPVKKEKAAPAKKDAKAPAKKEKAAPAPAAKKESKKTKDTEIIIQSPMGGEITPEEIMSRIGDVDKVYIRIDQNAAYWVKGEESGAINLW